MKTINALLNALLIVGMIAFVTCKNSTSPDTEEFEPFTVGSFHFTSPDHADYIGTASQKVLTKSDTTVINEPGQQQMELTDIKDDPDEGMFSLTIIDSTIKADTVDEYGGFNYNLYKTNENLSPLTEYGLRTEGSQEAVSLTYDLGKLCEDSGYAKEYDLVLDIKPYNSDSLYKKYIFKVSQFSTTIDTLVGC